MARPPDNERHPHAAFVEAQLAAPQTAAAAAPKARQRPIVAGEDHHCPLLQTERRQFFEEPAHLAVVFVEHRAELPLICRATGVKAEPFLAGHPRRMSGSSARCSTNT